VVPDSTIVLKNLTHQQMTIACSVGQAGELAVRHQRGPTLERRLRMNMMLPSFSVDQSIHMHVSIQITTESVLQTRVSS